MKNIKQNDNRNILHCDCNGFFASVELLAYPEYKDKPVVVGGSEDNRHGIVLAKNEVAKKYNIKTAQTLYQARKLCPDLIVLPPSRHLYTKYNKIINEIYNSFTDLVEPFGIDESYLDITNSYHLFASSPEELADLIRKTVREKTGLTISVGVSFNKIFAKLASDYKKPDATTVITKENYKEILWPLSVDNMMYVGKSTNTKLTQLGITTIGRLANTDKKFLIDVFGKHGNELYNYANGIDDSKVSSFLDKAKSKSIGSGTTFSKDLITMDELKPQIMNLSEDVGFNLRKQGIYALTVQISIKNPEFKTIQRQCKVKATNLTKTIYDTALRLLLDNWQVGKEAIRAFTVTCTDLQDTKPSEQISFFSKEEAEENPKDEQLQKTLDNLKLKYGNDAVKIANTVSKNTKKENKET